MLSNENLINEENIEVLIQRLKVEKERHIQEKLAKEISTIKNEQTAKLVAELLYSNDGYIRNVAIEILVALNENSLEILKQKVSDEDRNIRKFALDALKYIIGERSCEIAMVCLEDSDENVVEAALEVISHQKYKESENKLLEVFKRTKSTWIINGLLRTFASLEIRNLSQIIEEKISSLSVNSIEKNIIVNTYVRTLGSIGSYDDIDVIIGKYSKEFMIDDCNLIFGLCKLVIKEDISKVNQKTMLELISMLKEHWDFKESSGVLVIIEAFIKLEQHFFLDFIEKLFNINKAEEYFAENLYELIQRFKCVPDDFIYKILKSQEPELVVLGLKLILEKKICINNNIVEELCNSSDKEIGEYAIRVIKEIKEYNNPLLLNSLKNYSEEFYSTTIDNMAISDEQTMENQIMRLVHQSIKIRKATAEELVLHEHKLNTELLENIVSHNEGEEGLEALQVLFKINPATAWKYITTRMDSKNEGVRAGFIDIVSYAQEEPFYHFMTSMINDPSLVVRKKAIKTLNKRINDLSLSLLSKLYFCESDSLNRMEIVANLFRFNNEKIIDILKDAASSTDILTRLAAVKSLSYIDNGSSDNILKTMLEDPIDDVREAAMVALEKKGGQNDII